ncbi:MAG TPA: protease modulator HflK, partial [Oceanospirillaceae bacterium]|nr:protease modulator HflK [Oceanospirillaceae bacterium]
EGEAPRFSKLLAEYQKAPEVTRERLYLVAMEDVLSNSNKVLVDVDGGNNMMVLPLDQIMSSAKRGTNSFGGAATSADIDEITNQVIQELGTRTTTRISTRESR